MESYIHIDPNMIVNTTIEDVEVVWRDVRQSPFSLHGFYEPLTSPIFRRVPADVAEETSEGVSKLCQESAGGRVRFSTNSPYVAIRAKFRVVGRSSHLTLVSTSGFDLYIDGEYGNRFVKEFRMPYDMTDSYEQIIHLESDAMRSLTINFPVHAVVERLEIGLKPDAVLDAALPRRQARGNLRLFHCARNCRQPPRLDLSLDSFTGIERGRDESRILGKGKGRAASCPLDGNVAHEHIRVRLRSQRAKP